MSQGSMFVKLLAEDNHHVPESGPQNRLIRCFNPAHDDQNPSCSINVTKGVYKCFSCGIEGGILDYLILVRGLSKTEALNVLKGHGWSKESMGHLRQQSEAKADRRAGRPSRCDELPAYQRNKRGKNLGRAVMQHEYRTADDRLTCTRVRFEPVEEHLREQVKKVLPYTPRRDGGWWECDPKHDGLPAEDVLTDKYPLYRVQELLKILAAYPDTQVWIVEGEKCVDLVIQAFPGIACTTSIHHYTNPEKNALIDWEPLRDRNLLLLADTDVTGRKWITKLAALLHRQYGCTIRMVLPPGDGGYDVGQAIEEGGRASAEAWIQEIGIQDYVATAPPATAPPAPDDDPVTDWAHTTYYQVLGFSSSKDVIIQSHETYECLLFNRNQLHTEGVLLQLAPIEWWKQKLHPYSWKSDGRAMVASELLRGAYRLGTINLYDILGRGAIKEDGVVYYNMGDHVLTEDAAGALTVKKPFKDVPMLFEPGPIITTADADEREGVIACRDLYDAVMRYRFASPNEGRSFLGWIVTSLIGGALAFRPMMWMIGRTGIGKTNLLTNVLKPVLGNTLSRVANVTEAAIAQMVSSSALPIYLDEFEPPADGMSSKYDGVMQLARMATSGDAHRVRGGAGGTLSSVTTVRFSLLVSSVDQKNLSGADRSRFTTIRFAHEGVKDYERVEAAIAAAVTRDRCEILRHHIIKHAAHVVAEAETLAAKLRSQYESRLANTLAALTAGVGFLSGDATLLAPTTTEFERKSDLYVILEVILSKIVRFTHNGTVRELAISEMLQEAYFDDGVWRTETEQQQGECRDLIKHLARFGIRMANKGTELRLAYSHHNLGKLLHQTPYATTNLLQYLKNLPGVHVSERRNQRMKCAGNLLPYAMVPISTLESAIGFSPGYSEEELAILEEQSETGGGAAEAVNEEARS